MDRAGGSAHDIHVYDTEADTRYLAALQGNISSYVLLTPKKWGRGYVQEFTFAIVAYYKVLDDGSLRSKGAIN